MIGHSRWAGRSSGGALALALGAGLSLVGCGSSDPEAVAPSFVGDASLRVETSPSAFTSSWRFSPSEPRRGSNAAEISLTDRDGLPLSGWKVSVVPWMPAHAHGTSVAARVDEIAAGVYVVQPLYLYMGGRWELRTTLDGSKVISGGGSSEIAVPAFDIQ